MGTVATKPEPSFEVSIETAEDLVRRIQRLLDDQQVRAAMETAARAAELFPEHPWLTKANKVLNSGGTVSKPARDRGVDRRREYEWLRENQEAYKGRWVALLEGELIACAESFEEVFRQVSSHDLKARPLVHHIA